MSETTEALLDAAYDEVVSGSWARARMADVARAAGVSRQTLYNEFGTKDALADALARRQALRFLDGVDAVLAEATDPFDGLEASIAWTLDRAHDDPLLKSILTSVHDGGEGTLLLPLLTTRAQPLLADASARMFRFAHRHLPDHDPAELTWLVESLTRLVVSHVVLPTEPTEVTARTLASLARRVLSPA